MIRPILAIDIESGGCQPSKHPLIAIGTCLVRADGSEEKKLFTLDFDFDQFEASCVEQFWSRHMDKLEKLKAPAVGAIADYVDCLDKQFDDLTLISDNPSYDIDFINYYYDTKLNCC